MLVLLFCGEQLPPLHLLLSSDALYGDGSPYCCFMALSSLSWWGYDYVYRKQKRIRTLASGATIDSFLESESGRKADLPFTIQLDSFRIAYYPGTEAPADYISYITYSLPGQKNVLLHEQISMNRIFTSQGFRFYQSSFDDDGKGSWLTVNYDP